MKSCGVAYVLRGLEGKVETLLLDTMWSCVCVYLVFLCVCLGDMLFFIFEGRLTTCSEIYER